MAPRNERAPTNTVAAEIYRRMKLLKLNPTSLERRAGVKKGYIRDVFRHDTRPRADLLQKIAEGLGCATNDLTRNDPTVTEILSTDMDEGAPRDVDLVVGDIGVATRSATIIELDVRGAQGAGTIVDESDHRTINEWQIPLEFVRSVTYAPTERIKIITAVGDSMEPTFRPYEKVMVDTTDRTPTPPGIFVVFDGLALVIKRVSHIPDSEPPRVVIRSDNDRYEPYERTLGEAHIQGRVLGRWQWV